MPELSETTSRIASLDSVLRRGRNPIDVTAQGVNSGGLQKSIELLDASDEVEAMLVVLSLSSETRMPFKQAELKPVIDAQRKPIVFIPTRCRRLSRARTRGLGVVVLSG